MRSIFLLALYFIATSWLSNSVQSFRLVKYNKPTNPPNEIDTNLWSRYTQILNEMLKKNFPKSFGSGSSFHIVSTPESANWENDSFDLNENFAKFAIKPGTTLEYISHTEDRSVSKIYENMVMKCKNPQAFLSFKKSATVSYPDKRVMVSYPWIETGKKLKDFIASNINNPVKSFGFVFEETFDTVNVGKSGQIINGGKVAKPSKVGKGGKRASNASDSNNKPNNSNANTFTKAGGFIKSYTKDSQNNDDDFEFNGYRVNKIFRTNRDKKSVHNRFGSNGDSDSIGTSSIRNSFKFNLKARGIDAIDISPGSWFDRNFIKFNAASLKDEFIGPNGKLPILPKTVFVAQNPEVELELSYSEFIKFQSEWENPNTIGMSIGGAFFRTTQFAEIHNDDDTSTFISDSATFSIVNEDQDATENDEDQFSKFPKGPTSNNQAKPSHPIIHDKIYKASFKSNDPRPQIIAVAGEYLS